MNSTKLTQHQLDTLYHLCEYKYAPENFAHKRTLESLEDKGLVRWYPYGHKDGCWKLTAEGRKIAKGD